MKTFLPFAIAVVAAAAILFAGCASEKTWTPFSTPPAGHVAVGGEYVNVAMQSHAAAMERSAGCIGCHEGAGDPHFAAGQTPGEHGPFLACQDCHGGDGLAVTKEQAHPKPRYPGRWSRDGVLSAANPERSYTLLNDESPEWIRFVNPGDLRAAPQACGGCHEDIVLRVSKSLMTTAAHFWGVASYANGVLPNKRSILGESYSPEGIPQRINTVADPPMSGQEMLDQSVAPFLVPLPRFEVTQMGNIYRVFEKGSRLPNPLIGIPDKLEEPGRPNNRLSDRGLGTLLRIDFPLLNIHKTRLNDPHLSFMGTNDQPGDFRSSGCTGCHVVYANDRDPIHAGPFAHHGNRGWTSPHNPDPTIPKETPGHPIEHRFTSGIPSSQCMVCHMHQPNAFLNSYYGYTMWTYETDGDTPGPDGRALWPEKQKNLSHEEFVAAILKNPEEAAARGNWIEPEFLANSSDLNARARHTQFADYHGHGWMFRAVFKMDREGNLLDKDGAVVPYDDPGKFSRVAPLAGRTPPSDHHAERKAVHLRDIHAERGMHCVDCHFERDVHGTGLLHYEYQAAVEITCQDCHGTVDGYADLASPPTGPASADGGGAPLGGRRVPVGSRPRRFEWKEGKLIQRSMVEAGREWIVPQVKDSIDPDGPGFNAKASYAKTIRRDGTTWGAVGEGCDLAHGQDKMECYSCHTSWITSCFGCHLPQRGNIKADMKHFEGDTLRNLATYNPQVARDSEFMLGIAGDVKGNRIAPVRSSSAVLISSEDALRRLLYIQQPTISAPGFSSQSFNTHFPHTVRTTETRTCDDCHLTSAGDNNAWLAQTFLLGTNAVGFMGHFAYVAQGGEGFSAVKVTEWEEPQAVIGSPLHRMAWPRFYGEHEARGRELKDSHHHGGIDIRSLQLRGEYLYTASGRGGFRVYDVANVANKDFSETLVTSPVSPLGQDTHVPTRDATAVALAFNNPISHSRRYRPENRETRPKAAEEWDPEWGNMHPLYRFAYITDRYEGLILVDVDCLTDGDPENNFLSRAITFNPDGVLDGAVNLTVAGETVYVCCDRGLVAVSVADPRNPRVIGTLGVPAVNSPTSVTVQFRYAFVTDAEGLKVVDVGTEGAPFREGVVASVPIGGARDVYVAKTYAYVASAEEGLVIVDVTRTREPRRYLSWNDGGSLRDLHQVKVATAYDSLFAYLADGEGGLKVVQLVSPDDGLPRSPYGFSPRPSPRTVATWSGHGPVYAISKALDRDRAVDESGHQLAVFGRIGGRPMNLEERARFYERDGRPYQVNREPVSPPVRGSEASPRTPEGPGIRPRPRIRPPGDGR